MTFTASKKTRSVVAKMTSAACLLLLLCCSCCNASPLRGSVIQRPAQRSMSRRMLMMDQETPSPTNSPSEPPTVAPSTAPSPSPTVVPVVQPVSLQYPTATPSASPTEEPSQTPPTRRPPTEAPTETLSPSISEPTPAPARFLVPLADFGIQYAGDSSSNMQAVTEEYLLKSMGMKYDSLSSVELVPQARRRLQVASQTTKYTGTAVFESEPLPSEQQVQETQTVALEDTDSLQTAYDAAGVDVVVQQVEVETPENGGDNNSMSSTDVGLIAGVSVAVVVLLALVIFAGCKWYKNRNVSNKKNVVDLENNSKTSSPARNDKDYVKYTPDDFEPSSPKSLPLDESMETDQSVEVSVDMDEYSLSAASADSSKKDPEQRHESLLRKLALYQKTEKKQASAPPDSVPMPAALFVPQVVGRGQSELTVESSVMDSHSSSLVAASARATSLLDQSGAGGDTSEEEEELLPPPVPVSTGNTSQWALDTPGHELVPSEHGNPSQWALSPTHQQEEYERSIETQLVPAAHDFPSTTWAHPIPVGQSRSYSDGPSDEMNAVMEQDLSNFQSSVVVSPGQPSPQETPVRRTRSPLPEDIPPPPQQQAPPQKLPTQPSRARSTERRSGKPPRADDSSGVPQVTPPRKRSSSSRSRRGLELQESEPPPNAQRRRPRSSSSRRRTTNEDEASYDGSYDGSFASNGSEVIEDLNSLSDFLRERREAKRAQRRERAEQYASKSRR